MKCGHTANAKKMNGEPVCAICIGLTSGAEIVETNLPDLSGRKAKCPDCKKIVDSNYNLAFFEYRPEYNYDSYYCGCRGWD